MTTPKPASAPPADALQTVLAEMRKDLGQAWIVPGKVCAEWADRIEAASAQVLEVEPTDWKWWNGTGYDYGNRPPVTRHDARPLYSQPPKPAAEPVPVAQDFLTEALARLQQAVNEPVGGTILISKADACAIGQAIAGHARREAELESQLVNARTRIGQLEAACDGRFADYDRELKRANALEASLAACQENMLDVVAKYVGRTSNIYRYIREELQPPKKG